MSKVYYAHTTKLPIVKEGYVPPATIAITMVGGIFRYGISICSRYDNFSKKSGREIAENRLNNYFGSLPIPELLRSLPEKQACLSQLYNLTASVVVKNRKWKKRITKFNLAQKLQETQGKLVEMNTSSQKPVA